MDESPLPHQPSDNPQPRILTETVAPKQSEFFNKTQWSVFYIVLGLFGVSVVGSLLSRVSPALSMLVYVWFLACVVGGVAALVGFVAGLVTMFRDHGSLLGSSIVFGIIVVLVGAGTCAVNISFFSSGGAF